MHLQLSISLLISKQSETLEKCLHSLVPLLQNVSSELIIVYTGQSNEFPEIIKKYTSQVMHFQWCDDFSKARNAGLSKASGEWFLFIDDDEWFEDCTEIIDFFKTNEYKEYSSACYLVRNYTDMGGEIFSDNAVARMVKRVDGIKFKGMVHETFSPWSKPTKYFKCFVHHYGYAKGNPDKNTESYLRNIPLLEREIQKEPDNIRNYVQLAQEYRAAKRYKESEATARKAVKIGKKLPQNYMAHWSAVYLVSILMTQGEILDAFKEGEQFLSLHYLGELYQMYLYFYLTPVCFDMKYYEKGVQYARNYISLRESMNENPYKWDEQQRLNMNKSNITGESHYLFISAAKCACNIDDFQAAAGFLKEIDWESEYKQNEKFNFFEDLKKLFPNQLIYFLPVFESVESAHPYILLQKALYYDMTGDLAKAENIYYECQAVNDKSFSGTLISMAIRHNYRLPSFMETMDLDEWKGYAQDVAEQIKGEESLVIKQIESVFSSYPLHRMILQKKVLAEYLYDRKLPQHEVIHLLRSYCNIVLTFNRLIYREELFEKEYLFCLPKECRAALDIERIFGYLDCGKINQGICQIREMNYKFPFLSYVSKQLADYANEKLEQSAPLNNKQEFEKMGNQVKNIMKTLAQKEQYQEALKIAEELETLLPDDEEVIRYRQMLQKMTK